MQYLVVAYDGTDEGALDRRMAVRPDHLANVAAVKEKGSVICAGGITDSEGKLIGSMLVMEYASRELLDEYLENEPYVKAGVWQSITVETMNVVIMNDEPFSK